MAELEASTNLGARRARPLSPHLQIYRPMLTMMMSIVHRITGAALYFGMAILAWWLLAAASGPNAYATFEAVAGSLIGEIGRARRAPMLVLASSSAICPSPTLRTTGTLSAVAGGW